jgi:ribose transport system substrate-binding protein
MLAKMKFPFLMLCLLVLVLGACNSEESTKSEEVSNEGNDEKLSIGFTVPTLNNPYFVDMQKGAEKAAEDHGVSVTVVGGDNDITKQVQQVEDFIQKKVDAMVIQTVDTSGIVTAIELANSAGIPVLTTGETPAGGEIKVSIGFDNFESGENAGKYLAEKLNGKAKIVELIGVLGQETSRIKSEGFRSVIDQYPDMELLDSQPAEYDRATAMNVMENFLQKYPELNAVYAANDEMALGAIQAIKAANRLDEITVIGNDGTDDALNSIKDGEMTATNATPAFIQGYIGVDMAVRTLDGENVPSKIVEKNFIITKEEVDNSEEILKGVEPEQQYWLEQFE